MYPLCCFILGETHMGAKCTMGPRLAIFCGFLRLMSEDLSSRFSKCAK
jgi:hypothetical protein